ncbi:related to UPC2 - regulatory protein involved in control of sterol uptake [Cephalotrichum gorgonifer]|uniref:Related to UPC2 - regulatory protein involved in control of sterol uptake n=1 Tax=Cephalotrichum gorgonifer TaxID=2041049 RepID=A0AAE8MVR0_9PEZI|nr:related to UPC2 - regulatory protein involved in control of sterol uptake [Cephalotrichum gorgonifer]
MPPRRSHKKSRAGCRRCKIRKIKCNEVHPQCGHCVKHGAQCDFDNPVVIKELLEAASSSTTPSTPFEPASPSPSNLANAASVATQSPIISQPSPIKPGFMSLLQPPAPTIPLTAPAGSSRLTELRLMHHYTAHTAKTLTANTYLSEDVWVKDVPRLAFDGAPYLTDAMLAVAALHLRSRSPGDKEVIQASHAYISSSLAAYREALSRGINETNAEALFLTATLIAFQATATRLFVSDNAKSDGSNPQGEYILPLEWFHAFQGVKAVVVSSWQWIKMSNTVLTVIDSQPALQLGAELQSPTSFFGPLLGGIEDEIDVEDEVNPQATRDAYLHAVSVLNWAHKSPFPSACLAFPATVTRRFIELVELKRSRALVISACFFALLKRAQHLWWIGCVPRQEIMGVASLFEPGSSWWPHLEWPLKIALHEGTIIPPEVWGFDWVTESSRATHGHATQTYLEHIEAVSQTLSMPSFMPRA